MAAPMSYRPQQRKTPGMDPRKMRAPHMMADGGLIPGPGPIGGGGPPRGVMPPKKRDAPPMQDPDMDGDVDTPVIRPEAVNYHDEPHSCSACKYNTDGQCGVLQMEISLEGGCNAFEAGAPENPDMAEDMGMEEEGAY